MNGFAKGSMHFHLFCSLPSWFFFHGLMSKISRAYRQSANYRHLAMSKLLGNVFIHAVEP